MLMLHLDQLFDLIQHQDNTLGNTLVAATLREVLSNSMGWIGYSKDQQYNK
jgi:hypothetical protein